MKKSERLNLIKQIVLNHAVETQHELLRRLEAYGVTLTQATISRYMNEIGIIKVPSAKGRYIYGLSNENDPIFTTAVAKPIKTSILSISDKLLGLEQFININVIPGNSQLIKTFIMSHCQEHIFSLTADDNSLLLIAKSEADADHIRQSMIAMLEKKD